MRRALVAVVLVAAALAQIVITPSNASASKAATLLRPPGTQLEAGFRVARGTRLLGAVFPKIASGQSNPMGWKALLVVESDALGAMNAYAAQAGKLGYRQVSNPGPHCWSPDDGEVFCKGFYVRGNAFLDLAVHVCRSCGEPGGSTWSVSEAQLDYTIQTASASYGDLEPISPPVGIPSGGSPPPSTPTAQLTSHEYRQMLRHPGRGAEVQGFDLRGSLLVAPATSFASCQPDLVGVVSGTDLHEVVSGQPTSVNGSKVTTASDGSRTWTLVQRNDLPSPVLLSDFCSD